MAANSSDQLVWLNLNNPVFQSNLLNVQKPERNATGETLSKMRKLNWNQLFWDSGLKWETISSVKPPKGSDAILLIANHPVEASYGLPRG